MFQSIKNDTNGIVEVKKSKFIADVFLVDNEEEANKKIEEINKKYFDAKHHCFAYRIGVKERCSDDGEPQGTAGAPLLDIIKKRNLDHIIVVVTRYFGGTLLGTGGLVKAYSDAFLEALDNTEIVSKDYGLEYKIEIDYKDLSQIQYLCKNLNIEIEENSFNESIELRLLSTNDAFNELINNQNMIKNHEILNDKVIINV